MKDNKSGWQFPKALEIIKCKEGNKEFMKERPARRPFGNTVLICEYPIDDTAAVFCNPPYGREIGKWVQKAFEEARGGYPIVLLIPARTDTAYFHDYIYGKAEIRFVRGRLRFTDDDGNAADPAPFPSMVVIYNGERVKE